MSNPSTNLSKPYYNNFVKKIDIDTKNIAKKFNLSEYDEVMEQGLGLFKKLGHDIFKHNSNSEITKKNSIIVSEHLHREIFVNQHGNNANLSYDSNRVDCKRKIFKYKKKGRRLNKNHTIESYINHNKRSKNTTQKNTENVARAIKNKCYYFDSMKKTSYLSLPLFLTYLSPKGLV